MRRTINPYKPIAHSGAVFPAQTMKPPERSEELNPTYIKKKEFSKEKCKSSYCHLDDD